MPLGPRRRCAPSSGRKHRPPFWPVWGPGQMTPVHDHTVYGLIGLLRGREIEQRYARAPDGTLTPTTRSVLSPGQTAFVSPSTCDLHSVANGLESEASISIHVYGGNIGAVRRHTFDVKTGEPKLFVSGYTNKDQPNLWDRSVEARAES